MRRGEAFLAVDISALHGSVNQVKYTCFDRRVSSIDTNIKLNWPLWVLAEEMHKLKMPA